jgi:hypothetical protein
VTIAGRLRAGRDLPEPAVARSALEREHQQA